MKNHYLKVALGETQTMSHDEFVKYVTQGFIDEAIDKKDRCVSIYLGKNGISISVYPLEDEEE